MDVYELHRLLDRHHPVTDAEGHLKVSIAGRKRHMVHATWEEAARLWNRYPGRIGIMCFDPTDSANLYTVTGEAG
jgi:hypothetical protein